MDLMMGKLYDALRSGNIPDEKAREAAEEVAGYETRLSGVEAQLSVLTWMVGTNLVLTVGVLGVLLRAH